MAEPNILKLCAKETVNSYSTSAIHAYTDGSAFKATINAGFGILISTLMGLLLSTVTAVEPTAQIMKQKILLSKQPCN